MNVFINRIAICVFTFIIVAAPAYSKQEKVDFPEGAELIYYGKEKLPFYPEPLEKVRVADKLLYVLPGVIVPTVHGAFFVKHTTIYSGEDVLDIGTGSGIQGIFAADKAHKVVSTDISSLAVENTKLNVKFHRLEHIIDVRQGDLFEPVKENETFDVILFNIDAPYNEESHDLWAVHERFFDSVNKYLKPDGRIYYQGGRIDNIPHIQAMVTRNRLRIMKINMARAVKQNREPFVFLIQRDERHQPTRK